MKKLLFVIFLFFSTSFSVPHSYAMQEKVVAFGISLHNSIREFGYWKSAQVVGFGLVCLLTLDRVITFFSPKRTVLAEIMPPPTLGSAQINNWIEKAIEGLHKTHIRPLSLMVEELRCNNKTYVSKEHLSAALNSMQRDLDEMRRSIDILKDAKIMRLQAKKEKYKKKKQSKKKDLITKAT